MFRTSSSILIRQPNLPKSIKHTISTWDKDRANQHLSHLKNQNKNFQMKEWFTKILKDRLISDSFKNNLQSHLDKEESVRIQMQRLK